MRMMMIAGTEMMVDAPAAMDMTIENGVKAARRGDVGELARFAADVSGLTAFGLTVERAKAWLCELAAG